MGKISKVLYQEVPTEVCTPEEAGAYYYHQNVIGLDPMFHDGFIAHEEKFHKIRSRLVKEAMQKDPTIRYPDMTTVVFGTSATKNKMVLIVDLQ